MFNASFKTTVLSSLAAAVVATTVSIAPAHAGGGRDPGEGVSTISSTDASGTTTSIRSRNGADSYTLTRTRNGKVVEKKKMKKKRKPFVTLFNPDGTSRTITRTTRSKIPFATIHNPDGTSHTVAGTPSRNTTPFVTIHNADGTSHTIAGTNR